MTPSVTEREKDNNRIKYLQQQAGAGHLVNFNWTVALLNGKEYRMNGLHSSTMLCGLDGMFPDHLKVHLDTFEVDEEHDLPILFRQFDPRRSARTQSDVSGAYQMMHESLRDLRKGVGKIGVEGINAWLALTDQQSLKGDDVYEHFDNPVYHDFLRWLGTVISMKKTPELRRKEVIAAMYATFLANEAEARTFWAEAAHGRNGEDTQAAMLDGWLEDQLSERDPDKKARGKEFYQACLHAWNAYRDGKSLSSMRYPDIKRRILTAKS